MHNSLRPINPESINQSIQSLCAEKPSYITEEKTLLRHSKFLGWQKNENQPKWPSLMAWTNITVLEMKAGKENEPYLQTSTCINL